VVKELEAAIVEIVQPAPVGRSSRHPAAAYLAEAEAAER
jgi:hypothetical protein